MPSETEPLEEQKPKMEQPVSPAELSRQYLSGKIGVEEYIELERHLTPRFGEYALGLEKMLRLLCYINTSDFAI